MQIFVEKSCTTSPRLLSFPFALTFGSQVETHVRWHQFCSDIRRDSLYERSAYFHAQNIFTVKTYIQTRTWSSITDRICEDKFTHACIFLPHLEACNVKSYKQTTENQLDAFAINLSNTQVFLAGKWSTILCSRGCASFAICLQEQNRTERIIWWDCRTKFSRFL